MTIFLIQSAILLAIAFILGAIIGCLFKRMFAADNAAVPAATAAVATSATVAAASAYTPKPEPIRAPEPLPEPVPTVAAPVMAAAPVVAKPKAAPKPKVAARPKSAPEVKAVAAVRANVKDDLKLIVGIGPVNERKLNAHGVFTFAQIAAWKKPDIIEAEKYLEFDGRIEREQWVRQAKQLAIGGKSEDAAELARQGRGVGKAKPVAATAKPAVVKTAKAPAKTSAAPLMGTPSAKPATAKAPVKPAAVKPAANSGPAKASTAKATTAKKPMAVKLARPVGGKPDNLTLINGIGNVIEKKLHELGVFHFEQVANWNDDQAAHFSKAVGFPGRAKREGWMKEAALFAKGGTTVHARKVEAGDIPTSRKSTKTEKAKK